MGDNLKINIHVLMSPLCVQNALKLDINCLGFCTLYTKHNYTSYNAIRCLELITTLSPISHTFTHVCRVRMMFAIYNIYGTLCNTDKVFREK